MTQVAIRVEGLGKRYRLGQQVGYKTLRETLLMAYHTPTRVVGQRLLRMRHPPSAPSHEPSAASNELSAMSYEPNHIWALKDVSFEVKQGEAVGIIGRNGSGKSTLLKILSRITAPTEGCVEVRGRLGSLLEVGTGFHPELTGRENVYLNGAVIGMSRAEVDRKFDDIVAFSEIEKFLDTPVKRYSSGMHVRLAFAVAAHLEPEVLIVDEVLAVGDAAFQKKCLGKMGDVTKEGRTVLFVSHNLGAVRSLCSRAILLNEGKLVSSGATDEVVRSYTSSGCQYGGEKRWRADEIGHSAGPFRPIALRVRDESGEQVDHVLSSEPFAVEIEYELSTTVRDLRVSIYICGSNGEVVLHSFDVDDPALKERHHIRRAGRYVSRCYVPADLLNGGDFFAGINAGVFNVQGYFNEQCVLAFNVDAAGGVGWHWPEGRAGWFRPALRWETRPLS